LNYGGRDAVDILNQSNASQLYLKQDFDVRWVCGHTIGIKDDPSCRVLSFFDDDPTLYEETVGRKVSPYFLWYETILERRLSIGGKKSLERTKN
jgi:hypothetical protein